jgi:tetratricopeptide (TPR) repeat protein
VLRVVSWSFVAYIGLVWICLCYIRYPVIPYGLWDIVEWVVVVAAVTFVAIYTVYAGGALIAALVLLLTTVAVTFSLSLLYVCWVLLVALRKHSYWLKRYRPVVFAGAAASVALATFVDGSYRFWDRPFEIYQWAKFVFVAGSAWAALFCHLVRDKLMDGDRPRKVLKWTAGLVVGIGLLAYWNANGQREEYFLRKNVIEHPKDASGWLDLARHYTYEGDKLAADSGDEDHSAPDPTPAYRQAVDCLNQAMSLGANGFKVYMARAQLADELGEQHEAASFGRQALNLAPASPGSSTDEVKWLQDMIARNAAASPKSTLEDNVTRVRSQRRDRLPGLVRWVFEVF